MVVASADDSTDLHKLANMADKVEVATPTVAALSGDRPDRTDVSEMELLREEVARLADLVSTLQLDLVVEIHPDHAVLNSPTPSISPSTDSLCWYHARFGEEAQKCKETSPRPDTSGDRCYRPELQSPFSRTRCQLTHVLSR